jgi:hypothetical protein
MHVYNPSYLRGRGRRILSLRLAQRPGNNKTPSQKQNTNKRTEGMAEVESLHSISSTEKEKEKQVTCLLQCLPEFFIFVFFFPTVLL